MSETIEPYEEMMVGLHYYVVEHVTSMCERDYYCNLMYNLWIGSMQERDPRPIYEQNKSQTRIRRAESCRNLAHNIL